jgi:hypothetical protein
VMTDQAVCRLDKDDQAGMGYQRLELKTDIKLGHTSCRTVTEMSPSGGVSCSGKNFECRR